MAAHYCKEHQTMFFKKGKMKGYAHPIKDSDGEDTGEWCNEEEKQEEKKEEKKEYPRAESTERQTSIEAQNAYSGVIQLIIHDKIKPDGSLALTALAYAASKLSQWGQSSKPITEKAPEGEVEAFANVGVLLNFCAPYGINRKQFMEIVEVDEKGIVNIDISKATQKIMEHIKENNLIPE